MTDPTGEGYAALTQTESKEAQKKIATEMVLPPLDKVGANRAAAALNQVTPGQPDRADLGFLAQLEDNGLMPVGGELITPTAVRPGENPREAHDRGFLAAMTSAHAKEVPQAEKQANIQKIVDAAKAAGVAEDKIAAHLQRMGISVTKGSEVNVGPQNKVVSNQSPSAEFGKGITEAQANAYLSELEGQANAVYDGRLEEESYLKTINEALTAGVPENQIKALMDRHGLSPDVWIENAKHINDSEVDKAARELARIVKSYMSMRGSFSDNDVQQHIQTEVRRAQFAGVSNDVIQSVMAANGITTSSGTK